MNAVILSSPLALADGFYLRQTITKEEAQRFVDQHDPHNYCGHETVRVIGLEPNRNRDDQCESYDVALALKPRARLEFGREYTAEEIDQIGVDFVLLYRADTVGWGYEGESKPEHAGIYRTASGSLSLSAGPGERLNRIGKAHKSAEQITAG